MAPDHSDHDGRHVWVVSDLPRRRDTGFDIAFDAHACAALAADLDILEIRKLRFVGALHPEGTADWRLEAQLGATVVQNCVVTLDPVTTRIEEPVIRRFVADLPEDPAPGSEVELTADETEEPLGREIDLLAVVSEALALALPAYPRAEGAEHNDSLFAEPGVAPLSDDDMRPFAGLAGLKSKLQDKD